MSLKIDFHSAVTWIKAVSTRKMYKMDFINLLNEQWVVVMHLNECCFFLNSHALSQNSPFHHLKDLGWRFTQAAFHHIHNLMLLFLLFDPTKTAENAPLHFFTLVLLTWPQEEVYQSRHAWRLQGIWVCGLEDMALQWKGRRGLWSRRSKHWTSRDLIPPSQFLEHWEETWCDWYSNSTSYYFHPAAMSAVQGSYICEYLKLWGNSLWFKHKKRTFCSTCTNPAMSTVEINKKQINNHIVFYYNTWSYFTPFFNFPCGAGPQVTSLSWRGPLGWITVRDWASTASQSPPDSTQTTAGGALPTHVTHENTVNTLWRAAEAQTALTCTMYPTDNANHAILRDFVCIVLRLWPFLRNANFLNLLQHI